MSDQPTAEEVNRAVAEALGWKRSQEFDYSLYGIVPSGDPAFERAACYEKDGILARVENLPNFYGSLDAIHEAEKIIVNGEDKELRSRWFIKMQQIGTCAGTHATAPQRCEAFLRVKGLWRWG